MCGSGSNGSSRCGAIVSLVHDVMFTLGVFSFFRLDFDLTIVAALLTILGYSINDTVVIYDRIRENLQHVTNGCRWTICSTFRSTKPCRARS